MKKFFKKLFWLGFFSAAAYYGYKFYQKVLAVIGINKTLPQYMENVIGERPKINLTLTCTKCSMKALFTKETLDKNNNIDEMIQEYIDDFYPVFANGKMKIELAAKPDTEKEDIDTEQEADVEDDEIVVDSKKDNVDTDFED